MPSEIEQTSMPRSRSSAGRHVSTTTVGGTFESFVRDATGRVVLRAAWSS